MGALVMSYQLEVDTLRSLIRGLVGFRALYESEGIDTISGPDGTEWVLWDIEYLYEQSQALLPRRQAEAIKLMLYQGLREADAAIQMRSPQSSSVGRNPVGLYVTQGLGSLISMVEQGQLPRFKE